MITVFIRKVAPWIALVVLFTLVVREWASPMVPGNDMWFHLRMGKELLASWPSPSPGHLGRFDTADWVSTQWLSQLGMAFLANHFGLRGVIWLFGATSLLLITLLYFTCRREAAPLGAVTATAIAVIGAFPGLTERPQLFSYVLVVVVTRAWLSTAEDGRPRWWLVPLQWLWVLIHGMWLTGILIGAAAVVGILLARQHPIKQVARLASIPLLSFILAAASPLGLSAYTSLLGVGARSQYFAEWQSPEFSAPDAIAVLCMVAGILLVWFRRGDIAWPRIALFGLALAWALFSVRTVPVAALMLAPLLAGALGTLLPDEPRPPRREEQLGVLSAAGIAAAALVMVIPSPDSTDVVPSWVDQRLDSLPAGTGVLNDWDRGPYLLWRHPDLEFVTHGYGDIFTDEEIERNANLMKAGKGWFENVKEVAPDYALLDPSWPLAYNLVHVLEWETVEGDDEFVFLVAPQG